MADLIILKRFLIKVYFEWILYSLIMLLYSLIDNLYKSFHHKVIFIYYNRIICVYHIHQFIKGIIIFSKHISCMVYYRYHFTINNSLYFILVKGRLS